MLKSSKQELLDSTADLLGSLGERIRYLLQQRKLPVSELAQVLGVSRQSCYKWLRNNQISDVNLLRVAAYLEVSPQWLKFGVTDSSGCDSSCDGSCHINCGLLDAFVARCQEKELVWELCLEPKIMQWHGDSEAILGIAPEAMPRSIYTFMEWVCPDYRDIFLQPLRRAVLASELSSTLVPLCLNENQDDLTWVNCTLHTNCGGKLLLGSLVLAEVPANAELSRSQRENASLVQKVETL